MHDGVDEVVWSGEDRLLLHEADRTRWVGVVMNEMTSAQVYKARQVVIARAAEENQRLYDVMVATKARQRRVAQAVKPVQQVSVMGRVKAALLRKNKKV